MSKLKKLSSKNKHFSSHSNSHATHTNDHHTTTVRSPTMPDLDCSEQLELLQMLDQHEIKETKQRIGQVLSLLSPKPDE